VLREILAGLKQPTARGKLDGLLHVELVLASAGTADDAQDRSFVSRHTATVEQKPALPAAAPPGGDPAAEPSVHLPVNRRARYGVGAAVVALPLVALALWWSATDAPSAAEASRGARAAAEPRRDMPARPTKAPRVATEHGNATTAPHAEEETVPPTSESSAPATRHTGRRPTTPPDTTAARRRPEPVDGITSGSGYLRIGGPGAARAEIVVDGRPMGFAPRLIELPVGTHDLELRAPDGRVVRHTVSIDTRNTRSSAAVWIVPDA
jgi:hypothetical protein